jgi:hypothetical protein
MVRRIGSGLALALLAAALFAPAAFARTGGAPGNVSQGGDSPAAGALARLAALNGDRAGTVEWTGARTSHGTMNARYSTTGFGSAVMETLISDGVPAMTTVYHADGPDLRMTHYCGARNQPRLKASKIDLAGGTVDFVFVDATNLSSPDAPHVTGLELRFGDEDPVTLTFVFEEGSKKSRERIALQRVRAKA